VGSLSEDVWVPRNLDAVGSDGVPARVYQPLRAQCTCSPTAQTNTTIRKGFRHEHQISRTSALKTTPLAQLHHHQCCAYCRRHRDHSGTLQRRNPFVHRSPKCYLRCSGPQAPRPLSSPSWHELLQCCNRKASRTSSLVRSLVHFLMLVTEWIRTGRL
jgi:hypothetical protein